MGKKKQESKENYIILKKSCKIDNRKGHLLLFFITFERKKNYNSGILYMGVYKNEEE